MEKYEINMVSFFSGDITECWGSVYAYLCCRYHVIPPESRHVLTLTAFLVLAFSVVVTVKNCNKLATARRLEYSSEHKLFEIGT